MKIDFTRKFFVKDLLTFNSVSKGASLLEFSSFRDFVDSFLQCKLLELTDIPEIIIPVVNKEEASLLSEIDSDLLPITRLYLKDFSFETLSGFRNSKNKLLYIDRKDVDDFWKAIKSDCPASFIDFLSHTRCVVKCNICKDNYQNILDILTAPFFLSPVFCQVDVYWDWVSLEELSLKDIKSLDYFLTLIRFNMYGKELSIDWSSFGKKSFSTYKWNLSYYKSPKKLFVKDKFLYIDNDIDGLPSKLDLSKNINAEDIDLFQVDSIRSWYDAKFTDQCKVKNKSLISISQNYKVWKNPSMIPYSTKIVDNILRGSF